MKKICLILILSVFTVLPAVSQRPRIAVLDIQSSTIDPAQAVILTDIFRTELFKTALFQIVEQTQIQQIVSGGEAISSGTLGRLAEELDIESIMVMNLERLGTERLVFNVRIIEVPDLLLVYTENFFLPNEDHLFDTLVELTQKVRRFFSDDDTASLYTEDAWWLQLGADERQIELFGQLGLEPGDYTSLRQYDISFGIEDFEHAVRRNWDLSAIQQFFQAEISYYNVKRAFSLGLFSLDHYRAAFRPKGFDFNDYIDAYENNILSPEEYRRYREGYRRDHLIAGIGGVADNFPIVNADFGYPLVQVGWEHFWTSYQRNLWKTSSEVGLKFLLIAPTPYLRWNFYIGQPPYYLKLGAGVASELLLGGHVSVFSSVGIEVLEHFEVSVLTAWTGTQPQVSYTDLETRRDEPGYVGLSFPYYGIMFSMKLTNYFF
ncbi:hypothetical protein [Spirochaeta dissipatitropha]